MRLLLLVALLLAGSASAQPVDVPVSLTHISTHATRTGLRVELRGSDALPAPTVALDSALVLTFVPMPGGGPAVTADAVELGPWTEAMPGASVVTSGDTLRLLLPVLERVALDSAWARYDDGALGLGLRLETPLQPDDTDGFYQLDDTDEAWTFDTVVLDAGHGGHDVGATANGIREKDVTLGVVRRLGPLLETLGVRVVYTRTTDVFIPLRERGRMANAAGGKLFVSVHVNATATGARARGTETYLLGLHKTDAAESVMRRENSVVRLEDDAHAYASYDVADLAAMALAGSAFQTTSERLAAAVQDRFRAQGRVSRGVRQAGFYVLWSASMPAVLVETGFVNDPAEAAYLGSASGQDEVARAIFEAVRALIEANG